MSGEGPFAATSGGLGAQCTDPRTHSGASSVTTRTTPDRCPCRGKLLWLCPALRLAAAAARLPEVAGMGSIDALLGCPVAMFPASLLTRAGAHRTSCPACLPALPAPMPPVPSSLHGPWRGHAGPAGGTDWLSLPGGSRQVALAALAHLVCWLRTVVGVFGPTVAAPLGSLEQEAGQ